MKNISTRSWIFGIGLILCFLAGLWAFRAEPDQGKLADPPLSETTLEQPKDSGN